MANENPGRPNAATQPHHPYWLVGLVLLGIVVAMLAGAFLLDKQLRPRVGIEHPPAASAATPTVASAGMPSLAGQPSPISTAAAEAPTATSAPSGPRVANSPLEREIEAAYLKYWDIRAEALYNLDPSRLPEVMMGVELARERERIAELKAQGKAAKIDVEHRTVFVRVSETEAELYDEYLNKSYLVDAQTKQPTQIQGQGGIAKVLYQLRKIDGSWRVSDGTRHD